MYNIHEVGAPLFDRLFNRLGLSDQVFMAVTEIPEVLHEFEHHSTPVYFHGESIRGWTLIAFVAWTIED